MEERDPNDDRETREPIQVAESDLKRGAPQPGVALCLSGGGYRAMLFHLGSLWRLNEIGFLPKVDRISSVSGGSITAGMLGLQWDILRFDPETGVSPEFVERVVMPIRGLAATTIDAGAIFGGVFGPGTVSDRIIDAYREHLFGNATLQALPDKPRFVINATNVQSGALWRFSKPYMRDYRVGEVKEPKIELALAVAASSAFPPVLSPVVMKIDPESFTPKSGQDLQEVPYTREVVLSDGGVYDNMGVETAWKRFETILVSDAGGKMQPEPEPKHDWARHAYRVFDVVDNQVRSLRKRQIIQAFIDGQRKGAYWGIRTNILDYGLPTALPCPFDRTMELAATPTRLKRLEDNQQERLINWGYAVCDAALRRHYDQSIPAPTRLPYPGNPP
jgi:NTE family protein